MKSSNDREDKMTTNDHQPLDAWPNSEMLVRSRYTSSILSFALLDDHQLLAYHNKHNSPEGEPE